MHAMTVHGMRHASRGYVLLEVLISIIILAIGLLGVAKLQASTRQMEMESYQRAQAVVLLQDMVARISANRSSASCYAISDPAAGAPYLGTGQAAPGNCASGAGKASQQAVAVADMTAWHDLLLGSSEQDSNTNANIGAMIGARGCISYDAAADLYVVTVTWQGIVESAPPPGLNCAINTYGNETQRRAVSAVVRIADLNP